MADTFTLSGADAGKLVQMGATPGQHVVLEVMGVVTSQTADSVTVEVQDVKVLSVPRNFKDAAARSYVALRIEPSVG